MIYHGITKSLYMQVRDTLVAQIESGEYSPGDALPGERLLAEMFDVSRVTIRKSIGNMVEEGYLIRSRGKETVVANRKVNHRLGALLGVVEELADTDSVLEVKVLNKRYEKVTPDICRHLSTVDTSEIYAFSRLIMKDRRPWVVNYSYVVHDIGEIVDSLDLRTGKVLETLEKAGYTISYAEQVISAGTCTKKEAELLDYMVTSPVLIIKRTTFLENGYPILYERSIYRADEYQYSIKLLRNQRAEQSQT